MADVFLNSTYFSQHSLLTLAPPSGYTLNLKALIKVSNSAEHLSFHIKYCDLHLKEHSEIKEKLKKHLPKAPVQLGLSQFSRRDRKSVHESTEEPLCSFIDKVPVIDFISSEYIVQTVYAPMFHCKRTTYLCHKGSVYVIHIT